MRNTLIELSRKIGTFTLFAIYFTGVIQITIGYLNASFLRTPATPVFTVACFIFAGLLLIIYEAYSHLACRRSSRRRA